MSGAPDWNREGRDWPNRSHSRFVERGGIRWHVQVMGKGPSLLLVHGTGASTHSFRQLMPLFAERFTVVSPDLPGQGFSSASPRFVPSLPATAAALDELLCELAISPVVAVGHSAGAALITQMTLDGSIHPRLLVGLGAALVPFRGLSGALFLPAARLLAGSSLAPHILALRSRDSSSVERLVRSTGSKLDARGIELYQRLACCPGHVAAVLSMMANWNLEALFAALPRLHTRLLLLAGDGDKAIPLAQLREVAARAPDARLLEVRGVGHLLHEEKPGEVTRLIFAELDALAASPAPEAERP